MSITSDFEQLGTTLVLDMETAMAPACFEGRDKVRLLQLLCDEGECWYDLATFTDADWAELKVCLENPALTVIGQNIGFDFRCLLGCGITLRGRLEDTMIQSALLTNGLPGVSNSLEAIAKRVLGQAVDKTLQKQDWMAAELNDADLAYAMGDVRTTFAAWREMRAQIKQAGLQQVYDLECALIPAVVQVEHSGLRIDTNQAAAAIEQLEAEITESRGLFLETLDGLLIETTGAGLPRDEDGSYNLRAKDEGAIRLGTKRYAGFNINSAQQVLKYLNALGIEPVDPKTEKPSIDKKVLRPLADLPVVQWLLAYKRAEKRRSMIQAWLDKHIAADGRIHARFAPLSTGTGRFTCSNPNLQQVPRESYIRDCFIAAPGSELVVMDVKNMEMAVACSEPIANEFLMQQALREGVDLHTLTAHLIFNTPLEDVVKDQRQRAKSCFSGDTEVLTEKGWCRFDQYDGSKLMQYTPPAGVSLDPRRSGGPGRVTTNNPAWDGNWGVLSFTEPLAFKSFRADDVWEYEDRNVSICATGDHDIFWLDAYGAPHKTPLSQVPGGALREMVVGGHYRACSPALTEAQERVLAMCVADGSWKNSKQVRLGFTKRRKAFRCAQLLDAAEIDYSRSTRQVNGKAGVFFAFSLSEVPWLNTYCSPDKDLTWDCLERLDGRVYLEESQYWDGITVPGTKRSRIIVSTTRSVTADVMQGLAVTRGFPCTVGRSERVNENHADLFRVSVAVGTPPTARVDWAPIPTDPRMVYCAQVPSGLLLIRRNGKVSVQGNCNFGLLFGSGAGGLKDYFASFGHSITLEEAMQFRQAWLDAYPAMAAWHRWAKREVDKGEVRMVDGRRRWLVGDLAKPTVLLNNCVQGTAASIVKLTMVKALPELPTGGRLVAQIHDEIIAEVPVGAGQETLAMLQRCLLAAGREIIGDSVDMLGEGDVALSWGQAK